MMTPLISCPRTSANMPSPGGEPNDVDLAALAQMNDVEVGHLFGGRVKADVPESLVSEREHRLLDLGHVVDCPSALHGLAQHEDVIVARRITQRPLVVRKLSLVEGFVVCDEFRDARLVLFRR